MKKDESFLRWGMPGWTFIVGFILFVFLDFIIAGDSTVYDLVNSALTDQELLKTLIATILIAAAGIPIGFIINQIYFYIRWNSPVSKSGFLPPLIVGREVELKMMLMDLEDKDLEFGKTWRDNLLNSATDHRGAWHYISQLLTEIFSEMDHSCSLAEKHHYYLTTLHSLGASQVGFTMGFILYLIAKVKVQHASPILLPIALLIIIITLALLNVGDYPLDKTESSNKFFVRHWAEVFIASLFFLFFALYPYYGDDFSYSYVIPLLICTVLGIYWGMVDEESSRVLWLITLLLVSFSLFMRITNYANQLTWINWSVLFSILVFNSISLAFLKNRQNTRDALGTLEYYTLRRYLESREHKPTA